MTATTIEWTDATWNPVTGCTKVSAGCRDCYAERVFPRAYSGVCQCGMLKGLHGTKDLKPAMGACDNFRPRKFTDVRCHEDRLDQPLHWKKPRRVFVNSMSDLFHEDVPDDFIKLVLRVTASCPQHQFQILTKRPKRMLQIMSKAQNCDFFGDSWHRRVRSQYGYSLQELFKPVQSWAKNLWLGVSVEDQKTADERIPLLLQTPAAVHFVSYEPALGPVDFGEYLHGYRWMDSERELHDWLRWIIIGGESGPGARPFNVEWAFDVLQEGKAAGVPVFVKQLGSVPTMDEGEWRELVAEGSAPLLSATNHKRVPEYLVPLKLRDSKGGDPQEWPEDLRVREWPR